MGVVTDLYNPYSSLDEGEVTNRPIKYDLDDGTGVIKVWKFILLIWTLGQLIFLNHVGFNPALVA